MWLFEIFEIFHYPIRHNHFYDYALIHQTNFVHKKDNDKRCNPLYIEVQYMSYPRKCMEESNIL